MEGVWGGPELCAQRAGEPGMGSWLLGALGQAPDGADPPLGSGLWMGKQAGVS